MARFEQMRDRLPTLYRPEAADAELLSLTLRAVAEALERLDQEASEVSQAHWFEYADRALYSPYFIRSRRLADLPFPGFDDPELDGFPYIHDLARLGALLGLSPWQDPPTLRETVEPYRARIERFVKLYKKGLGTPGALRRMIEAQLPLEDHRDPEERDRPFYVEELVPLEAETQEITTSGELPDMVAPLMRWTMENDGLAPVPPTIYVQGVEPREGVVAPTEAPLIELYDNGDGLPPLGIGYKQNLTPGETLRLRPAYTTWTGHDNGLRRAHAKPTENTPADPTAPGPWYSVEDAPEAAVVALHQSHDHALWLATKRDDGGELWRFDGRQWQTALSLEAVPNCLAEDGGDLLIGTADGLLRMSLYPDGEGDSFEAVPVEGLEGWIVNALLYAEGCWWVGTSREDDTSGEDGPSGGIFLLEENDEVRPYGLGEYPGTDVKVYAVHQDASGVLYFGTDLTLFQYQPGLGRWYYFVGGTSTKQGAGWKEFVPGASGDEGKLPGEALVFLPPVHAVYRGRDASLWLGTDHGIARYLAFSERELTYATVLEAFPDMTGGRIFAIEEDARGLVWFCTDRGLLRYDGRDWSQWQAGLAVWKQLGSAANLFYGQPEPRGSWRFSRSSKKWERKGPDDRGFKEFHGLPRTTQPDAVTALLWTDQVEADRGQWDGQTFVRDSGVSEAMLQMRCKPSDDRILNGGLPAAPRLPVGQSEWRYLSLEPEGLEVPERRPAWTVEGRLLPPPDRSAPWSGRYYEPLPLPSSGGFDDAIFTFEPAARVWFRWEPRRPLTAAVRLQKRSADENIDPAILDRVWQGIGQVRPAGARVVLAVEDEIVRGGKEGG